VLALGALAIAYARAVGATTNLAGEVAMSAPPTVTAVGPTNNSPTITNGVMVGPSSPPFRFSRAEAGLWGTTYPINLFYVSCGITGSSAFLPYVAEFETDAQELEILTLGAAAQYRLRVNGQYVGLEAAQGPPADGSFYWLDLAFPDRQRRAIALESFVMPFGGLAIGPQDQLYRPRAPLGPRCIVLGDSYTEGLLCYAQRLAGLLGWEVWSSGVGGTGYINPGPTGRVKFRDRVESDVIAHYPDLVIVAGGLNDGGYPSSELYSEALALYDTILTNLPSAKLVVVGPWWPSGIAADYILAARDTLEEAASERNLDFIDPIVATNVQQINVGWITGAGNVANPAGDGNADQYISADGVHPTDLGHQYLAVKMAERLGNITLTNSTPNISLNISNLFAGLGLHGMIGRNYLIQTASDLGQSNWVDAATVTLSSDPQSWVDASSAVSARRFYRAVLLP
jgi:lysophospholipase L1-like esterase